MPAKAGYKIIIPQFPCPPKLKATAGVGKKAKTLTRLPKYDNIKYPKIYTGGGYGKKSNKRWFYIYL